MSEKRLPPDPMGDDTRAAIVRDLIEWWSNSPHPEIKRLSAAAVRQMAMEAGAFARGIMGEIAEIKQMSKDAIPPGPEGATAKPTFHEVLDRAQALGMAITSAAPDDNCDWPMCGCGPEGCPDMKADASLVKEKS
jgi:hypothetical protein